MRTAFFCATLAITIGAVEARPLTSAMTCGEAAGLVASRGAALLQTGPRNYDLYLASRSACHLLTEEAVAQFAPTLDNPKCHIGYLCRQRTRILWN